MQDIHDLQAPSLAAWRTVLSILVIEDLVMAFYLPLIGVLLVGAGVVAGLASVGTLLVALLLGQQLSRALFHRSSEVLLLSVLGIVGGPLLARAANGIAGQLGAGRLTSAP